MGRVWAGKEDVGEGDSVPDLEGRERRDCREGLRDGRGALRAEVVGAGVGAGSRWMREGERKR